MSAKKPNPSRTPEKLADGFVKGLQKAPRQCANLICLDRAEALSLSRELRRRGFKAKAAMGFNTRTFKAFDYVEVTGRKAG